MDEPLHGVHPSASEIDGGDEEGAEKQHDRRRIEPEFGRRTGDEADGEDGGDGQADRRERAAEQDVHAPLHV
ncbi:MAG: hypothetical protein ACK55I_13325, partial [bacterium]